MGLSPFAVATTVTWGGVPTARLAVDSKGLTLAPGSLVLVGTFANEAAVVYSAASTIAQNVTAITAAGGWKQFSFDPNAIPTPTIPDPGTTNTMTISGSGKAAGTVVDNNAPQADFFNGKPAYLWIFNAPAIGNAGEMGIFRATNATVPWLFPTNAGGVGDTQTYSSTATAAPNIAAIGGAGSTTAGTLVLVPEPSTFTLFGLAGAGFLSARRRKRNV